MAKRADRFERFLIMDGWGIQRTGPRADKAAHQIDCRNLLSHLAVPAPVASVCDRRKLAVRYEVNLAKRMKSYAQFSRIDAHRDAATFVSFTCRKLAAPLGAVFSFKFFVRFLSCVRIRMQKMILPTTTDSDLLAAWAHHRDESAFHELVVRYAGLVQMAAQRNCGDFPLAADASQLVFTQLAQSAKSLLGHPSLAGWLHVTASMKAKSLVDKTLREDRKRRLFQSAMDPQTSAPQERSWLEIQPDLIDAVNTLSAKDREAILLRFYRSFSVKEIAATLGIGTDAAQKRLDRATERLRGKLTRRGVTTAGSLSAVMLAGYASEAKAAALSTSVLSSKAIAASAATSTTSIFATLLAMKATITITLTSAVLLLLSGTWIVSQRMKIAALNQRSDSLETALAATSLRPDQETVSVSNKVDGVKPTKGKLDLKVMIADYKNMREGRSPLERFIEKYKEFMTSLSFEEISALVQELLALGAIDKEAVELADFFMPTLCSEDFPYVFEHFQSHLLQKVPNHVAANFMKWAEQDLGRAGLWLDRQVASGKLDSKSLVDPNPLRWQLEINIFQALFLKDPAAAEARIAALPEQERLLVFEDKFNAGDNFTPPQLLEMTRLIRTHLSPEDQTAQIASLVFQGGSRDSSEIAGLLDAIQAKPAERKAVAMDVALCFYGDRVTQNNLDELRASVSKIAPQQIDAATGHALAASVLGNGMSFKDAAALALHYHEAGGGDDLLIHFCGSKGGKDNKPAARLIAEKISNPKRREAMLNQLK